MRWSSLRIRLGLWYTLFTLSCLTVFGLFLTFYLGHALEASRAPTLVHRAERLCAFVESEHAYDAARPIASILTTFLKTSPETDEIILRSTDTQLLLFDGGGQPWLQQQPPPCDAPCFREFLLAGHHVRSYTETVTLAGMPVQLTLMGPIDEHYQILRTVRASYLLFVPFLLLASLVGGYSLSGRALLPVGRITAIASRLSITDLHGRVPVPRTYDELQTLAEAWNDMLQRLQASVERNRQFTADASHDLRTSIAVMLASAELSLRKVRTPEHYAATLRTLASECEHTLGILEDLFSAARAGFEQHELIAAPLNLSLMVGEQCALFAAEAALKDCQLHLHLQPELWIRGDGSLLHRLVGILVDNAIKYTPARGSVTVTLCQTSAQVVLRVIDTGPGIAGEHLSRIFARAFRAPMSEEFVGGRGLGLSIARWIAEAHSATLQAQSRPGQGSTFEVAFAPLQKTAL